MTRQRFSSLDTTWLRLDEPTNPMVVAVVLLFAEPIDREHLRRVLQERLLRFERFRQRAITARSAWGRPWWEDDPETVATGFEHEFHDLEALTLKVQAQEAIEPNAVAQSQSMRSLLDQAARTLDSLLEK